MNGCSMKRLTRVKLLLLLLVQPVFAEPVDEGLDADLLEFLAVIETDEDDQLFDMFINQVTAPDDRAHNRKIQAGPEGVSSE